MTTNNIDPQNSVVIQRCQREQHKIHFIKAFEGFSRVVWPGLAVILGLLIVANGLGIPYKPILFAIPVWIVISLGWVVIHRKRWQIPNWRLPAYLDRHAGAKGALLQVFETGTSTQKVPESAMQVPFPKVFPQQVFVIWLVLLLGYVVWYLMPAPTTHIERPQTYTPLPVQQTQALLKTLAQTRPEQDPFVESAEATLEILRQRSTGLEREDFEALELLQEQASERLAQDMARLRNTDALMKDFEQMLAQIDGQNGSGSQNAQSLSQQSLQMQKALEQAGMGMDAEQLKQLLSQVKAMREQSAAQQGTSAAQSAGSEGSSAFSSAGTQSLREQIKQYREQIGQTLAQAEAMLNQPGRGGVSRGPGSSPLEFNHLTFQRQNAQITPQTFGTNPTNETVLLAQGLTKRTESAIMDNQDVTKHHFQAGTETPYWQKRTLPRHRAVLDRYFSDE